MVAWKSYSEQSVLIFIRFLLTNNYSGNFYFFRDHRQIFKNVHIFNKIVVNV